jgi:hypothetical protein
VCVCVCVLVLVLVHVHVYKQHIYQLLIFKMNTL